MSARFRFPRSLAAGLLALASVAGARAQLAASSPFLPPQAASAPTGPTVGAPLENRGSLDTPGVGLQVRIYDPSRKVGAWLRVNEKDPAYDFVVKQYDTSRDTATVEYNGRTLILPLREAKVVSGGVAPVMIPPTIPVARLPPPQINSSGVANTAAANQSQLDALAATLAQRRALREQAAQQVNQGVQPAPQPQPRPQVQPQNQTPGVPQRGARGGVNVAPGRRTP